MARSIQADILAAICGLAGSRCQQRMFGGVIREASVLATARTEGNAPVGILMLETDFERFAGDIGNVATWQFPVVFRVVPGARPHLITTLDNDTFLEPFVEAGLSLAGEGVAGITTSCGFLSMFQREFAARLPVPVAASALLQVPLVERLLPAGRRAGIITFDATSLGPRHLAGAGCAPDTPIAGLRDDGPFRAAILGDRSVDGFSAREADALEAADRLCRQSPGPIGAIVLECTNLAPHAAAIQRHTGRPVYDIVTLVEWFQAGLAPRSWPRA